MRPGQPLARAIAAARVRHAWIAASLALPIAAAATVLAWRAGGGVAAAGLAVGGALASATWTWRAVRRVDARWIVRRLDADPRREDSSDLLFRDPASLGPLQALQRARVEAGIAAAPPDLRPAWPVRSIVAAGLAAAAVAGLALAWPERGVAPASPPGVSAAAPAPTRTTIATASLAIAPPAYTGLAATTQPALSAKVPAGTMLRWSLVLAPTPRAVELRFHDGRKLALELEEGHWVGGTVLATSALYRLVVTDGLPPADGRAHRLDALPDTPPRIRIVDPGRSLTLRAPGQRGWPLRFEASDDHGLGSARWVVTLAQGSGEQVSVSERVLAARGDGPAKSRRFATTLDLATLGFAQGDDLIVRLEVADNRAPSPQRSRSASVILRWPPPPSTESTGMEGLVRRALPAYFRSQRQIIIDTEALVGERGRLGGERFGAKSDAIGVDQRILRMRYGEFLGEENAGQPDAAGHEAHDDEPPEGFGRAIEVLEEYGHTHDDAEAATLLDPQTRALLKQALDAMWQSEGALRQAQPEQALPHQYRALAYIKQVQQATRIYLARVGLELPPIDEARRMTGTRAGIGDRRDGLRAARTDVAPAQALWPSLAAGTVDAAALADFAAWLDASGDGIDDPLGLIAAVDAVRGDPDCERCLAQLRARLWPLLERPAAGADSRPAPGREGAAYLDALPRGGSR